MNASIFLNWYYDSNEGEWKDFMAMEGGYLKLSQMLYRGSTLYLVMNRLVGTSLSDANIYAYYFNGTDTWIQAGGKINSEQTLLQKPRMAVGRDSTLYVALKEDNKLEVKHLDGTAWVQDGVSLNVDSAGTINEFDITCVGGTPYVVWSETQYVNGISLFKIFVKHFNGTVWFQDGGALNINPEGYAMEPRISSNGIQPYIVWDEDSSIYVKHLVGTAWVQDGGNLCISDSMQSNKVPQIAFLGTTPYVCWCENEQVYVKRLVP